MAGGTSRATDRRVDTDVAVVAVGDELLDGTVVDTNLAWLGRELGSVGIRLVSAHHCRDDIAEIVHGLRAGLGKASVVLMTGGLGPTPDDLAREALAELVASELVSDPDVRRRLERYARARGMADVGVLARMAQRPRSGRLIGNSQGSAPGVAVDVSPERGGPGRVYSVPGVPREMQAMVTEVVVPELTAEAGVDRPGASPRTWRRTWWAATLRESEVVERLGDLTARAETARSHLTLLAAPGVTSLTLSGWGLGPGDEASLEKLALDIEGALGVDATGAPPAQTVVELLTARGLTVATAESLTAGRIAAELATVAGSSQVLQGGVVAYAASLKERLLMVPAAVVRGHGVVSEECAVAMATGARAATGADVGISATGVAGPDPLEGHRPGTVLLACATDAEVRARRLSLRGGRRLVADQTVMHALDLLRRSVLSVPEPSPS